MVSAKKKTKKNNFTDYFESFIYSSSVSYQMVSEQQLPFEAKKKIDSETMKSVMINVILSFFFSSLLINFFFYFLTNERKFSII